MYYLELDLQEKILTDDYVRPAIDSLYPKYWHVPSKFIHSEITELFSKLDLELHDVEIFHKSPGLTGAVHHDVIHNSSTNTWDSWNCAVNINLDNTESLMYWFSTTLPQVLPTFEKAKLNGIHYGTRNNNKFHNTNDFTVLDKFMITKPTLVRTSVIHSVENTDEKARWCLSLRFKGNPTFEECAVKLKSLICNTHN
jgi:hypothetical protein